VKGLQARATFPSFPVNVVVCSAGVRDIMKAIKNNLLPLCRAIIALSNSFITREQTAVRMRREEICYVNERAMNEKGVKC
jgi:hypothetical protein